MVNINKNARTAATTKRNRKSAKKSFAAAHAVINTPEPLENILVRLPMKRLLLNQRVNKQFKATIDGSNKLQQALFFQRSVPDGTSFGKNGVNELLNNADFQWLGRRGRTQTLGVRFIFVGEKNHSTREATNSYMFELSFDNLSRRPKDRGESWRKMYLMQAPRKCWKVVVSVSERGFFHQTEDVIADGDKPLGEVFDTA